MLLFMSNFKLPQGFDIKENDAADFYSNFIALEEQVGRAVIGQKDIVRLVACAMVAGGNALLEGLPGLGKTRMVKSFAKALDLKFSRIQFTPDLMPSDVTGTDVFLKLPDGSSGFKFQRGPIFSNIVLADEINRATPKTQSALLEAMQEATVTVGGMSYNLPIPFFVLATQNPIEMEGTYPLPEAQLDRFMFKLMVTSPQKDELLSILDITTGTTHPEPSKVYDGSRILSMRELALQVPIAAAVSERCAEIVLKTHPEYKDAPDIVKKYVRYGASPRGAQALVSGAKIMALLDKRYNVSFSDLNSLALPVLRHRIALNFDAIADGVDTSQIVNQIIGSEK